MKEKKRPRKTIKIENLFLVSATAATIYLTGCSHSPKEETYCWVNDKGVVVSDTEAQNALNRMNQDSTQSHTSTANNTHYYNGYHYYPGYYRVYRPINPVIGLPVSGGSRTPTAGFSSVNAFSPHGASISRGGFGSTGKGFSIGG
jgi:hypothetical protein